MINVSVLGYGTVGSGVVEILKEKCRSYYKESRRRDQSKICP